MSFKQAQTNANLVLQQATTQQHKMNATNVMSSEPIKMVFVCHNNKQKKKTIQNPLFKTRRVLLNKIKFNLKKRPLN